MDSQDIYDQVNRRYGSVTKSNTGQYEQSVARAFGYTAEELASLPEGANLGLSCGNPIALAKLGQVCDQFAALTVCAHHSRAKSSSTWALVPASMSSLLGAKLALQARLSGSI